MQKNDSKSDGFGSIIVAILAGVGVGAAVGLPIGVLLRPKSELNELSNELLLELRDATHKLSEKIRAGVPDANRRFAGNENYDVIQDANL